ncbi:MAG: peptide chain release factor N(5)-glutamine methyltransferase [Betaproteobacteria bacterium]|nr:peptide chain release factor N(5)-glutamine methyltransferase [Betaproteobacteria bacterium]
MVEVREVAGTSIAEMLRTGGIDPVDARTLLRAVLGVGDAHLVARPGQMLTDQQRDRYLTWVARRRAGEPVAYLTGEREFYSLAFMVTPAVLIPRPETELLVELALQRLPQNARFRVLDLATGSGCVAIAIAKNRRRAQVVATEADRAALEVARENARRHATGNIEFVESNWFGALGARRFQVIVANPPYVAEGDPHLAEGDLRFEPRAALVAGADGLECIRDIVARAHEHLAAGGWLLFEHGHDQAARCRALLEQAGYRDIASRRDLAGIERVSRGRV